MMGSAVVEHTTLTVIGNSILYTGIQCVYFVCTQRALAPPLLRLLRMDGGRRRPSLLPLASPLMTTDPRGDSRVAHNRGGSWEPEDRWLIC